MFGPYDGESTGIGVLYHVTRKGALPCLVWCVSQQEKINLLSARMKLMNGQTHECVFRPRTLALLRKVEEAQGRAVVSPEAYHLVADVSAADRCLSAGPSQKERGYNWQ